MKKNVIIIIATSIIVILALLSLIIFSKNENNDSKLEDKVSQEIRYLDKCLISILENFNSLNNENYIKEENNSRSQLDSVQRVYENNNSGNTNNNEESSSKNDENNKDLDSNQNSILAKNGKYDVNWNSIQIQIEELYQTWNTIAIDLNSLNVDGNSILTFSEILNNSTQNIKNKDKEKSINSVSKLYQLLPTYSESFMPNSKETNILKIQSKVVTSYMYVTNEKWQEAQTQITDASNQFTNLLNSVDQNFQNQSTLNQCYIIINELNNAIKLKDKEIFFVEYQNLIGKMEII